MSVITVRIPSELESFVEEFCKEEDRTKAWLVKKALQEKMEDWRDYRAGVKALKEHYAKKGKTYSLESVAKELGVTLEKK